MIVAALVGYAVLLGVGGLIGYLKAGSTTSLVMGLICAVLACLCALAVYLGKAMGPILSLGLCVLLSGFFLYRFSLSYNWMPAGMMSVVSLVMVALLLSRR